MVYDSMPNYFEEERNKIARDVARQCAELGRPHVPEAFVIMDSARCDELALDFSTRRRTPRLAQST
jgi:hypothetical protein